MADGFLIFGRRKYGKRKSFVRRNTEVPEEDYSTRKIDFESE